MNIVYIIGNGFDINLGMKTKYVDFYEYYKDIESEKKTVQLLKNEILSNYKTWSDLELALGKYTEHINSTEDFDEIFEDIIDRLADYLEIQENNFDFNSIDIAKFNDYLAFPEKHLLKADENQIKLFKENWLKNHWKIDIITLNYTSMIEKIIDYEASKSIELTKHNNEYKVYLRSIQHIHGYLNERMIIGVNDVSQIKNAKFHNNYNILNAFIKSNTNKVSKYTVDDICKKQIEIANLICVFGSSLGETDKIWWELIGKQLVSRNCKLIIFERGENISKRYVHKGDRRVQEVKKIFLEKTNLTEDEKELIGQNIFIGINTEMFNLI